MSDQQQRRNIRMKKKIKARLKELNLTQKEAAQLMGISQQAVNYRLNSKSTLYLKFARQLLPVLQVTPEWFWDIIKTEEVKRMSEQEAQQKEEQVASNPSRAIAVKMDDLLSDYSGLMSNIQFVLSLCNHEVFCEATDIIAKMTYVDPRIVGDSKTAIEFNQNALASSTYMLGVQRFIETEIMDEVRKLAERSEDATYELYIAKQKK